MDLLAVARNRSIPGILLFNHNHRKEPIFLNTAALDTLSKLDAAKAPTSSRAYGIKIPREISNLFDDIKKSFYPSFRWQPGQALSQVALIPTRNETLCCRGFFIHKQDDSSKKTFHIMVLIEKMSQHHNADLAKCKERFSLTKRQMEVVERLASGACNKAVADQLCVSEDTIKGHMTHIMRQLKVNSRTEILTMIYQL